LPILECVKLSQFAVEDSQDDMILLFNVCTGEKFRDFSGAGTRKDDSDKQDVDSESDLLDIIFSRIGNDAVTQKINGPIDSARACFMLDSTTVETAEEFNQTIVSFYIHLLRHTRKTSGPIDYDAAGEDVRSLLNSSFFDKGGYKSALAEAKYGHNGGLKLVLDNITKAFRHQAHQKYINYILASALEPLDWKDKIDLVNTFLKRLKNYLPEDITLQPAENYVENFETLIKSYINRMDDIKYIFESL